MYKTDGSIIDGEKENFFFTYSEEEKQENEVNKSNAKLVFSPEFILIYPALLDRLSITEAMLFGFIKFFKTNSSDRMYFTNEQLAKIIHCSSDTISRAISKLEKIGFISTSRKIKAGGGQIRFINDICYNPDSTISTSQSRQKLQTNNNKKNDNKKNNNNNKLHQTRFDELSFFGISKTNIETWFSFSKSLDHILDCCNSIELISDGLNILPVYNKDTINATSIMLNKGYDVDYIIKWIKENGWDNCGDYQELIRSDYYLPEEID